MGLSGRKIKQRIPQDPRNLSWVDDASRFGSTYLSKLGFDHTDKNATLGISGVGLTQHLKVHHKLDVLGIGAQHTKDPSGIAWKQNRDFENLLKRLNANSENSTEDTTNVTPMDGFQPAGVNDPAIDTVAVGSEMGGRDQEMRGEKGEKRKEKKRRRDSGETSKTEGRASKKRKKAELTAVATGIEHAEAGPSSSNSPTPETVATTRKPHHRGRAHRARFIASKRLAAASPAAIAEILGTSSSPETPLPVAGVMSAVVTPQVENDEHRHLIVSSKSVADYFKEKMRLVASTPSGTGAEADETPRGGIGSRPKFYGHDGTEEGRGLRNGVDFLAKISVAETGTEVSVQEETPEGKGKKKERKKRKRRSEDDKGEANSKLGIGHQKAQAVSD